MAIPQNGGGGLAGNQVFFTKDGQGPPPSGLGPYSPILPMSLGIGIGGGLGGVPGLVPIGGFGPPQGNSSLGPYSPILPAAFGATGVSGGLGGVPGLGGGYDYFGFNGND